MAKIKATFHGTQVPNGEPLIFISGSIEITRAEITANIVKAMANKESLAFTHSEGTIIVNLNHVALIEVLD